MPDLRCGDRVGGRFVHAGPGLGAGDAGWTRVSKVHGPPLRHLAAQVVVFRSLDPVRLLQTASGPRVQHGDARERDEEVVSVRERRLRLPVPAVVRDAFSPASHSPASPPAGGRCGLGREWRRCAGGRPSARAVRCVSCIPSISLFIRSGGVRRRSNRALFFRDSSFETQWHRWRFRRFLSFWCGPTDIPSYRGSTLSVALESHVEDLTGPPRVGAPRRGQTVGGRVGKTSARPAPRGWNSWSWSSRRDSSFPGSVDSLVGSVSWRADSGYRAYHRASAQRKRAWCRK